MKSLCYLYDTTLNPKEGKFIREAVSFGRTLYNFVGESRLPYNETTVWSGASYQQELYRAVSIDDGVKRGSFGECAKD
jgi:hypothetical protein